MTEDVDQFVGSFNTCQKPKVPVHLKKNKEPVHSWTAPENPCVRMHTYLFTMGKKSKKGHKYVLIIFYFV